jgi:ATP-dependent exoDNAse (exonuclease V) alpha subunit
MGALMLSDALTKDGILLLAPTGKARVRLGKATNAEAMTVAQFLHRLGRYDGSRQRPKFEGKDKYRKEKTVVIDECSMLTMDDLVAVLEALDLAHVQRVILVGDPNQLPPIGVGRPFADLVSYLETTDAQADDGSPLGNALARLSVEVRAAAAASSSASDALRLASWFTREQQPVDADRVLSDLELGEKFNDLEIALLEDARRPARAAPVGVPAAPRAERPQRRRRVRQGARARRQGLGPVRRARGLRALADPVAGPHAPARRP